MKILVFPYYIATPHFETDLELIARHKALGDEVYVVICKGEMLTCIHNVDHGQGNCLNCIANVRRGLRIANVPRERIIRLPKNQPSYRVVTKRFENITELKEFTIDGVDLGAAAASTLAFTQGKEPNLNTIELSSKVLRELKTGLYLYTSFIDILEKVKPDSAIFFNGRFTAARMLMRACEHLHIDFFTHERTGVMNKFALRKNALPHDTLVSTKEILDCWNNASDDKEKIATTWYQERRGGADQGFHSYTKQQLTGQLPRNFKSDRMNIAIFNSGMEEIVGIPEWDSPEYDYGVKSLRKILKHFQDNPGYHFYLRVHPSLRGARNSQTMDIDRLAQEFSNITVISPESKLHSYTLMDHCSKIIVYSSTIGVEAAYWGKPVILIAKSMYEYLDCAYKSRSVEETINLIESDILPKPQIGALQYAYWTVNSGIPFSNFVQTGVITGKYLGKTIIKSNLFLKLSFYAIPFLTTGSLHNVKVGFKHVLLPRIRLIIRSFFKNLTQKSFNIGFEI